jgi:hypothetical protein
MSKSKIANIIGGVIVAIMMVVIMNPGYIFFAK